MTDLLDAWARDICPGHPIDVGIVRAVKVLRDAGIETFESCQGGPDPERPDRGHAYAEPTVRFHGTPAAGWRAWAALVEHGLPVKRLSRTWSMENPGEPCGPFWEVVFRARLD